MPPIKKPSRTRRRTYIAEWREYRGLTQDQVAEHIGVVRTTYGRMESGESPYNQDNLESCAEILGCLPGDLLDHPPMVPAPVDKLQELLRKATPEQEELILRLVKTLIEPSK